MIKKYMFTAKWCNQCELMKPIVSKIKNVKIINVEENPKLTKKYNIMSLPTFLIDDIDIKYIVGITPEKVVKEFYNG